MAGNRKETILVVIILVLIGAIIFETGFLVSSRLAGETKGGLFGLAAKGSLSKESRSGAQYLQPEWNPFQEMISLRERMNRMIDDIFNRGLTNPMFQGLGEKIAFYDPEMDVTETEKEVLVRFDLPGLEKDKIDIKIQNNYLTVSGVRNLARDIEEPEKGYFRKERRFGSFSKTFLLPVPVDESKAKATYQNGVLTIEIPKLVPGAVEEKATSVSVS